MGDVAMPTGPMTAIVGGLDLAKINKTHGDALEGSPYFDAVVGEKDGSAGGVVDKKVGEGGGKPVTSNTPKSSLDPPHVKMTGPPSKELETPPPSSDIVKIVVLPGPETEETGQQHGQQQRSERSRSQPPEILRVGSTAESVVDSWSPDLAKNASAASGNYDTAPYSGDGTEDDPTLRLARPVSKRGIVPNFSGLEVDLAGPDDGGGGGRGRRGGAASNFDTATSAFVFPREGMLSPIHSVVSSSLVDLNKPISLDDLRFEDGGGGGLLGTTLFSKSPAVPVVVVSSSLSSLPPSPPSGRSAAVLFQGPTDTAERESTDDNNTDDFSSSSSEDGTDQETPTFSLAEAVGVTERSDSVATDATEDIMGGRNEDLEAATAVAAARVGPAIRGPYSVISDRAVSDPVGGESEVEVVPSIPAASAATRRDSGAASGVVVTDNRISPFDAENASLWARAAAVAHRRNSSHNSSSTATTADAMRSRSRASSSSGERKPDVHTSKFRQALQRVGLLRSTPRVAPARLSPHPPGPDSSAAPGSYPEGAPPIKPTGNYSEEGLSKPGGRGGGSLVFLGKPDPLVDPSKKGRAPGFGSDGIFGKTPLMSPFGTDGSDTTVEDDSASSTSSSRGAAAARAVVEGDIEEGGTRATDGTGAGVGVGVAAAAASARVADAQGAARAAVSAGSMVLPCAPSDEEKAIYYSTGRVGLITCALVSFAALSAGMWLFTIVSPAFYWFGVPAVFLTMYLVFHYFGVAVWGKDFCPETHAEILRKSEEEGYQPSVDIFLPVCKEPTYLLANTWKYVSELDYPNVNVYVLDDGASDEVRNLAADFGFNYILRTNRPELKKAGNLRYAFAITSGEAIAIFDADFCPRSDFLKETVPYLSHDPSIGIVQTPQYFRYKAEQTWVEQGAGVTQEFFYRLVQVNQDKFNAAVCVGSCGVYRRKALEPFGGMAAIAHSEDMYTGYKMTENGFSIKYVPLPLAMGACPDDPQTFFMQQYRWCMGSATLVLEKEFWQSKISKVHKLCFVNGMLYYIATALLVFLAPVPILLLVWLEADGVLWYHSAFAMPSLIFSVIVMPIWSTQRYGMACHRVKIIQCYAHMYAIKDRLLGRSAPWVPSGAGASAASATYKSSVRLMVVWNIIITFLIVGGSVWRMSEHTWYHFVPAIALAVGSFLANMSTLVY